MRGDGESEPHIHSGGIPLYRRVQELINPGEGNDFGKLSLNLDALHAEDRAVHKNVFAASQLRMKTGPDFEKRSNASVNVCAAGRRLSDAT